MLQFQITSKGSRVSCCSLKYSFVSVGDLPRRPAAIDQERVTRHEGCGGGGEEHYCSGDLHRFADASQRDLRQYFRVKGLVSQRFGSARRIDEGRRDGVDGDVVLRPFHGQAFRQMIDGGLGHAVHGFGGQGHESGL